MTENASKSNINICTLSEKLEKQKKKKKRYRYEMLIILRTKYIQLYPTWTTSKNDYKLKFVMLYMSELELL